MMAISGLQEDKFLLTKPEAYLVSCQLSMTELLC